MAKSKKPAKATKATKSSKVTYPSSPGRTRIPVTTHRHKDKRVNIPTEELRDFVQDDENAPKKMLYPRDPSLDPQLVWKGKDEQDAHPLEVPVVPIYIQEKIQPQAIVDDIRAQAKKDAPEDQYGMFADFNGIKFEDQIDFYHHEQNWTNRMILGDSLLVMTSLAEKEGMKGKVQTIYLDPPYGIRFGSNWQVSTRRREVGEKAEDATRQPEQVKAFRDTWKYGLQSYLAYLRDRFVTCRELLSDSGSIFVQIGDENVHLVRSLLDEVFGLENYSAEIVFATSTGRTANFLDNVTDTVLWYGKNLDSLKYRQLFTPKREDTEYPLSDERGIFALGDLSSQHPSPTRSKPFMFRGKTFTPPEGRQWGTDPDKGLSRLVNAERIHEFSGKQIRFKKYPSDYPVSKLNNIWMDTQFGAFQAQKIYVVQTNVRVVERCLLMTSDPGDLVLDPTCGSGTTAFVAEQWGRRWITVDTSRVALALARTRLMSAKFSYYILSDSPEGQLKGAELSELRTIPGQAKTESDIRKGFSYKRVPHVTMKSIASNEEIDRIVERNAEKLESLQAKVNKIVKQRWEDWQVPREADSTWPAQAKELHAEWWKLRRQRQKEIDDSIARRADTELLYDQPHDDPKRIRVTGPFTVESLSPHRVLPTVDENQDGTVTEQETKNQVDFVSMILENLKKAGVQNTRRKERLTFERLDNHTGPYIHAKGEYLEDGKVKRCAVHIGPQYGTVSANEVKEAAKEAVKGVGYDLLIVCGFAFDPSVSEEIKQYGKLTVLPTRMNPDLAMGNELLKKTGAGNLFMVFGEPDLEIKTQKDGNLIVKIKGVDVYDPTTGQIRSSSTDDIACWFIDTNYNGESFFVRHAYFTGAQEPYEKLKRALRAEIDESAWAALYSTTSRPFTKPETGKIAVKVINHYGDEVLKVWEIES